MDVATVSVLKNPLVLNQIFSYLDAPTLKKSVRPVCTQWADLGAPFLAKLTTVTFSEDAQCGMETSEIKGLTSFHLKLAKNVKLAASTCPCDWSEELPENFVAVLPQIALGMEQLEINIGSSFLSGLHKMWRSHRFNNLTKISITVCNSYDENEFTILTSRYSIMPKVKVISIKMAVQYKSAGDELAPTISQKLLNSTPNLEEVELKGWFYLDFTPCKKLTKLNYTYVQVQYMEEDTSDETWEAMDVDKMAEMLTTCRESLTELSLDYVGPDDGEDEDDMSKILSLLSFPNLTRLTVSCLEEYNGLGYSLDMEHLPNLTHVSLAPRDIKSLALPEIFEVFDQPHDGIRSLDVTATYDGSGVNVITATEIVRLFPAVTTFQVKLTVSDGVEVEDDDDDDDGILTETLENLASWELTEALVEMKNVPNSGLVSATMQGLVGWRGMGHTEVRFCGSGGSVFVLGDALKKVLLASRGVKLVKMSGFLMPEKAEFQEFIEENGLRICLSD